MGSTISIVQLALSIQKSLVSSAIKQRQYVVPALSPPTISATSVRSAVGVGTKHGTRTAVWRQLLVLW